MNTTKTMTAIGLTLAMAGTATAGSIINVSGDITTSTTWTNDNTYNLIGQIYVKNGATLTIEAGTLVASDATPNGSGSLAITRGSKIIANGTKRSPIIFTSTNDDFVTWREAANEWGNITIMGRGYISNSFVPGNSSTCSASNLSPMEGLTPDFVGDPDTLYGGGDDDDDSGSLSYVSLRYGGRVVGLTNELNGLSLGGIGRGTDISHVEIMNNVDDGIEIWGGTVNLQYVSIWNVGDDSFDVDQGWRGKAQNGLIVQGYSLNAGQGSGVGDNGIEVDGAEDSNAQPRTRATIYNFTVIGQPAPGAGDGLTAWRDGAGVQYRQCIFMDCGERVVRFDNVDGDGSQGYGFGGSESWAQVWTTPYTTFPAANPCSNPAARYQAQSAGNAPGQGFVAEITDSVFFRNLAADAYTEADARGVTVGGGSNAAKGNVVTPFVLSDPDGGLPVASLTRAAPVTRGGTTQLRVISIDPRAANAAASSVGTPPNDGFYAPATWRGGFGPDENWICGWTAADAYGFVVAPPDGCERPDCVGDIDGSGDIGFNDLLAVLSTWGPCPGCPADLDGDNVVGFNDLLTVLSNYGPCP